MSEEFVLDADADVSDEAVEEVFAYGTKHAYRFERDFGDSCPCDAVEAHGSPVLEASAEEGALFVSFHADDMNHLQDVVTDLKREYSKVHVHRLVRSRDDSPAADLVMVDRSDLTPRQREVLQNAHDMGYFDHPKGANAGEVADALGITTSTFTEHLAAAQSKLLGSILDA